MIITFTNVIGAIRTAFSVVRSDLKMWLGFETSSIDGDSQITPDKSGNNNVGELFTGKALEFDGSTEYVEVPNSTSLNVGTDDFTYCFWVYIGSAKAQRIIDKRNTKGFTFYLDASNVLRLELNDGTGFAAFILGTLTPSVWQRVVVSADRNGNAICYINGVAQTPVDISSKSGDLTDITSLFIGADAPSGETLFFDGFITDIQWYNTILSQLDVTYDYANPNKLAIDNPSTSLSVTNLKGYWALSEGDGLVAYDSGTNLEEDEVVNGDFALDSNWSEGAGWDIDVANNRITRTAQSGSTSATQNISFVSGKSYSITYTLDVSAGSFLIRLGGVGILDTPARSVSDTYTEVITATANHSIFNLRAFDGTFAGSISNVSVREVTASDHGGLIVGADYVDAQPRIPQLGMMNWSKGSNLVVNSNEGSYGNSPASEILTTNPFGGNTAVRPVPNSDSDRYEQILLNGDISTGDTYTYSWFSKRISTPITNYTGNLTIQFLVNCTVVSGSQEQIATNIGGFDRFKVSFTIDNGSIDATFRAYFGNVIGVGNSSVAYWGHQLNKGSSADSFVLTDGAATSNSTVIPNPTIPTQDIFGNLVRDRLNSFNLDGSGYAEVADDTDLDFGTGDFTLECWAKYDFLNQGSGFNVLVSNGSMSSSGSGLSLGSSITKFEVRLNAGTAITKSFGTDDMTVGNWYHLVVTREGTILKTYRDTTIKSSSTIASVNVDTSLPVRIGRDTNSNRFYQNLISDVRLYKGKALSATEVENNYNAGLSAHTN